MYADTPFISLNSAKKIINKLSYSDLVLSTFNSSNNSSYGLVKLNSKNEITQIIEYKNANKKEKKITMCNSGIMGIGKKNYNNIFRIKKNKITKEFYLTDIVKISYRKKLKIKNVSIKNNLFAKGINTIREFNAIKRIV